MTQAARRFVRDQSGAIGILFALGLPVIVGFSGLAIDVGVWLQQRAQIQLAADAAAIAAARELGVGQTAKVNSAAQASAGLNGFTAARGAQVQTSINGNVVSVAVNTEAPLYFTKLFLANTFNISAAAAATFNNIPFCILALHASGTSVVANGNGSLIADGCSIQVNSSGKPAISGTGNASFSANTICVTGTYGSGTYTPTPQVNCAAQADPFSGLPPPNVGPCTYNNYSVSHTPAPLSPGVYCGGISASGQASLTLQPGIYILKNGGLKLSGQVSLSGNGVLIYLTGNGADIAMSGQVSVHLSAQTSGPYAGILIFGDRIISSGSAAFSGGNNNYYEGTVYLPTYNVTLTGNGSGTTSAPWSAFIADTITLSGNGNFTVNSSYQSSQVPFPPSLVVTAVHLSL